MDSHGLDLLQKLAQREAQRVLRRAQEDEEFKSSITREKDSYIAITAERLAAVDSEIAAQAKKAEQNKLEAEEALEEKHKLEWARMERTHKEKHEILLRAASVQRSNLRDMIEEENVQREARTEEKKKAIMEKREKEDGKSRTEVFEVFQGEIEKLTRGTPAPTPVVTTPLITPDLPPADNFLKRRIVDRLVEEDATNSKTTTEQEVSVIDPVTPIKLEKDNTPSPKRQRISTETCQVTPPVSPESLTRALPRIIDRRAHINALGSRVTTSFTSGPDNFKGFGSLQRFAFVGGKGHLAPAIPPPVSRDGSSCKAIRKVFQISKLGVEPGADHTSTDSAIALREWLMDKSSLHSDHVILGQCQNSRTSSGSYIQRAFDLRNSCEMKVNVSSLTVRIQKESGSTLWIVFKTLGDFSSFQPCFLKLARTTSNIRNAEIIWPPELESAGMGCTSLRSPLLSIEGGGLKK